MNFVLRVIGIFIAVAVAVWLVPGIEVGGTVSTWASVLIIAIDFAGAHQTSANDPIFTLLSSASNSDIMMTMVDGDVLFERGQWHVDSTDVARNIGRVLSIRNALRPDQD